MSEIKDFVPIVGSLITAILGGWLALKFKNREVINLSVEWGGHEDEERGHTNYPLLSCLNKSEVPIYVTDVKYLKGYIFPRSTEQFAVYFDDFYYDSVPFPKLVEGRSIHQFRLDENSARRLIVRLKFLDRLMYRMNRSRLWVEVRTSGNTKVKTCALRALPSNCRPNWLL